jgi:hypothetical protein
MFLDFLKMLGIILSIVWILLISSLYFLLNLCFLKRFDRLPLPVACFIPGFYVISWAFNRSFRPFIIAVFGGMLVRLLFIGTAFILIAKLTQLQISSLVFSLVGFYALCLVVELYFINTNIQRREEV